MIHIDPMLKVKILTNLMPCIPRLSRYNEIAFMKVDSAQSVSEICTLIKTKIKRLISIRENRDQNLNHYKLNVFSLLQF